MTISSTTMRVGYTASAGQTIFPYTFLILDDDDIEVYVNDAKKTKTTHYTVSGVGEDTGGNITFLSGLTLNDEVLLVRQVPMLQSTDYVEGDDFPAEVHEQGLDKLVMLVQQLHEVDERCLKVPITSSYTDLDIPDPEAGKAMIWKSDLSGLQNLNLGSIGAIAVSDWIKNNLLDDTSASDVRSTIGISNFAALQSLYGFDDMSLQPLEARQNLYHLLYPSMTGGYNELYLNGWQPVGFNQRWGGVFGGDSPNSNGAQKWFASGYIATSGSGFAGSAAGSTWEAMGFKVPETITVNAVWLRMGKIGNPQKDTEPLNVYICPDSGGEPDESNPITNGTMDTIDGPGFTGDSMASASEAWPFRACAATDSDLPWYRFTDASGPFTLTGGTQYYIVIKATGADGSNYFRIGYNASVDDYPHGYKWGGDDATPSNWTEEAHQYDFLIEPGESYSLLQGGGEFDGLLSFAEGIPTNESRAIVRPLKDFWNDEEFTLRLVTSELTASKTILDVNMGLLHKNRIRLYTVAGGYLNVKVYEADGTVHSITDSTTNLTSAGTYDIILHIRSKGDGSDTVELFIDGSLEGTRVASATITFDDLFVEIGHVTLGGGFGVDPSWDKDFQTNQFASGNLPSNDADTAWGGAATEASCMRIINNDVLYQNKAGYGSAEDGYYTVTTTLSNANGWVAMWRGTVIETPSADSNPELVFVVADGTKQVRVALGEYFMRADSTGSFIHVPAQLDLTKEHTYLLCGKGSDWSLYVDGKLFHDGTGTLTDASASNQVQFGDMSGAAGANSEAVWHEVLIYDTSMLLPEANTCELYEFAYWHGDQTGIVTQLYNSGTLRSVKELCGIKNNVIVKASLTIDKLGVEDSPSTTTTSPVTMPDMWAFALIPNRVKASWSASTKNNTAGQQIVLIMSFDEGMKDVGSYIAESGNANDITTSAGTAEYKKCGLAFIDLTWYVTGNTGYCPNVARQLLLELE